MPAAYAHHRFGDKCLESLPPRLRDLCMTYRELFDIGVHGPDTLFYYKPLSSNKVNGYGSQLHHWTGEQFFSNAKYTYRKAGEDKAAMLVYLLGFLAHFTLDSNCHDFINAQAEETEYSHNLIESQYDAFLMRLDGKDPLKVDRSLPIHASRANAAVIAQLFPFEEEQILESIKGQRSTLHMFYSPRQVKKKFLRKLIKLVGVKGDFGDLFLDREVIDDCQAMSETIYARQKAAAALYPMLAQNLIRFLRDEEELSEPFNWNFEGELL